MSNYSMHMLVCGGTGCKASESDILVEKLKKELQKLIPDEIDHKALERYLDLITVLSIPLLEGRVQRLLVERPNSGPDRSL